MSHASVLVEPDEGIPLPPGVVPADVRVVLLDHGFLHRARLGEGRVLVGVLRHESGHLARVLSAFKRNESGPDESECRFFARACADSTLRDARGWFDLLEDVLRSDPARYCPVCRRARPYTASAARPSSRFSATTFGSVPLALEGLFRPLVHLAGRVFLYSLKRGIFMHFFSGRLIPIHIFTLFRGMGLMLARVCKPGRVFRGHEKLAEGKSSPAV